MKKFLSVVLVFVLMMSVAVMATAADGSALENTGTEAIFPESAEMPSIDEAFNAVSDFLKLEAFAPYISAFHEALSDFYIQLDLWLRALGVVVNNALTGLFSSGAFSA